MAKAGQVRGRYVSSRMQEGRPSDSGLSISNVKLKQLNVEENRSKSSMVSALEDSIDLQYNGVAGSGS